MDEVILKSFIFRKAGIATSQHCPEGQYFFNEMAFPIITSML